MTAADYAAKYFELLVACEQVIASRTHAALVVAMENLKQTMERVAE